MTFPRSDIDQAFVLLPSNMGSHAARVMLAAIGYQETQYLTRVQYGNGPAHSYWQFEAGGGVKGVMNFGGKVTDLARAVCHARNVPFERQAIWEALAVDDVLGAAFARLLMYTDSAPLPTTQDEAWEMYAARVWRPGKPHPDKWAASWGFGLLNA